MPGPRLTARALNRATLARQGLLRRRPMTPLEAVRRVTAIQAQEPASPYLALWNRVEGFDPTDLDRAFADGSIVKATLMRVTLHAVGAEDYPALHEAMQHTLRAARLHDRRFRRTGLTQAGLAELTPALLAHLSEPRANADVEAWIDQQIGETPKPGVWWALRQCGPVLHAPTGGPWSFGPRPAYIGAPAPLREGRPTRPAAAAMLVRRYLEAFGPATAQDVAQFGMLYSGIVREGLEALGDALTVRDGPGKQPLYDVADAPLPDEDVTAPPRLLPMWDSTLLVYKDRSRVIPEAYRRRVIQGNGDVLPTLLVDGYVAGVWRPVDGAIEATAFHALDDAAWAGLEAEARALRAFLAGREPLVYRRYARWWDSMAGAEVRLLGG